MTVVYYSNMYQSEYLHAAIRAGLSPKAGCVYVALLEAGTALSPKALILKTHMHRQYVYDALTELHQLRLTVRMGDGRRVKYQAVGPDRLLEVEEKRRIDALGGVHVLKRLYDRSPSGVVEIVRGAAECVESEFQMLREAKRGDFLDIVGGAGMRFVDLFKGRTDEWEDERKKKDIHLRYIGSGDDVMYNRTNSVIQNESRTIPNIGDIVNVCIRPDSVSFNIYVPEVVTVRVRNSEAVRSQRELFEVLWQVAT
jgi:hypothetical protein